jgi:tetratricopeptide (TPR) repeat protein
MPLTMNIHRGEFAAHRKRGIVAVYQRGLLCLLLACVPAVCAFPMEAPVQGRISAAGTPQLPEPAHPIAKSQQERDDFTQAYALTKGGAAEAAANDFSAKYPDSELRHYLYSNAMLRYQYENNPAKMLEMGEKVLTLDQDNPLALVLTATAVADSLGEHDRDRERKMGIVKRNAGRAIQVAENGFSSSSPRAELYKTTLQSMAYSAMGVAKLKTGDDAGAEKDLMTAAELRKIRSDPYVWYHLALAQDHRKKYAAALNSVEQALQLASSNPELQKLAEAEHERLFSLARAPRNAGPQ